jgi:hypothetical protein
MDKTKGEITLEQSQLADSQTRNSRTICLLVVMVSLKRKVLATYNFSGKVGR